MLNWSDKVLFMCSLVFISALIIANFLLPINGLIFALILLSVFFSALCLTCISLHKLLQRKDPISNSTFNQYIQLIGVSHNIDKLSITQFKINEKSTKRLTKDIEKYFILNWYNFISQDNEFLIESKTFLEEVLKKLVETSLLLNYNVVLHSLLNLFLKHLKEYRRSLKRQERYNVKIDELYRYCHFCNTSNDQAKSKKYFIHYLTINLLHHFINSELWNSLPCHILVSILSRKLINYLLKLLSTPEVLNYILLNSIATENIKENLKLGNYGRICIEEFYDVKNHKDVVDAKIITEEFKEYSQNGANIIIEETDKPRKKLQVEQNDFVKLRKKPYKISKKSPKRISPVKIYEPKSSTTNWRDSRDLACISLGQDTLDILNETDTGEDIEKTIQKATILDSMHMPSMEGFKTSLSDATERTLHNIKDLQETCTVNNALHKFGDIQVPEKSVIEPLNYLHYIPPNTLLHSSVMSNSQRILHAQAQTEDEAAGMVEGILDFGRAGFRKGLRLTGLQDNEELAKINNSTVVNVTKSLRKKLEDFKSLDSGHEKTTSSAESSDSIWINPLQDFSPNYDGHILLEKSESTTPHSKIPDIPLISTEDASGTESPDPEYEDTADLASSIAKLRSLLTQRSSESNLSTPALSPMPDEFNIRNQDYNAGEIEGLEVDGMMTSFYKVCTKTASGVLSNTLHTIKTALPGNNAENLFKVETWKFTPDPEEFQSLVRIKRLLSERKQYCLLDKEIDTGFDALDSVDIFQLSSKLISELPFEDELEDFGGKIPLTKTIIDILCELLADSNSPLIQESTVKSILLLFGPLIEEKLIKFLVENNIKYLAENLINIPETTNSKVLTMTIEDYVENIQHSCPDLIKFTLGTNCLKNALKLFITSLQSAKINEDIFLQGFELIAMKLIQENTRTTSPSASASI